MIKIIGRVISVFFGASLFYYMPTLIIRMFGLENKWPNLITNVLGCEIIWPSLLFGVLGGIIGLFMDETSWDKFEYYFPAVIAALFWGIIGFYAGYSICDYCYLLPIALGIVGGGIGFFTGRGCWFGAQNNPKSGPR